MVAPVIIRTKFYPPVINRKFVARPQLIRRLNEGQNLPSAMTLISAPAGYGKSALVAHWLFGKDESGKPFLEVDHIDGSSIHPVWLSLEEADNDPNRFFIYFLTALRRVDEDFCPDLFSLVQANHLPKTEIFISELVNAMLDWKGEYLLVLDDFHHIIDVFILDVLNGILTYHPHKFHLIFITREDPMLPLARLRSQNLLTEIRAVDLRFSPAESTTLLIDYLELGLSTEDVGLLTNHTEGWVAGLQLAGLTLKDHEAPSDFVRNLSGSHRYILSYLTEEVLKKQPPETQLFLLKSSVLSDLNGDLCDAITGRTDSARLLENLLVANLFIIPLDEEGTWYRFHHLFRELLSYQLRRDYPDLVVSLHLQSSLWYEHQGFLVKAIEHGILAKDFDRVIRIITENLWPLFNQGRANAIGRWLEQIQSQYPVKNPWIWLGFAWTYLYQGKVSEIELCFVQIDDLLSSNNLNLDESNLIEAEYLVIRANLLQTQGKIEQAITDAQQALMMTSEQNYRLQGLISLALGASYRQMAKFDEASQELGKAIHNSQKIEDHVTTVLAIAHIAMLSQQTGQLKPFVKMAEDVITTLEQKKNTPAGIGIIYISLSRVYYEWNELEKAQSSLDRGIHLSMISGHNASIILGKILLSQFLLDQNKISESIECLDQAGEIIKSGSPYWIQIEYQVQRFNIFLAQGQLNEAKEVLENTRVNFRDPVTQFSDSLHLAWLRWAIASHHPDILWLAERIISSTEQGQRFGPLIQALVLGAQAGGGEAWSIRAKKLADPQGYVRTFMDFPLGEKRAQEDELISPLTERELEVLELLANGLTYKQMADQLIVSVNTIRYHVKGIYGKLGVEKQVQAIERARELRLL